MPIRYPDGIPASFPNQWSNFGSEAASTGSIGFSFGFNAALIKIVNDGPGPIYVNFHTTGAVSTADANLAKITTGDLLTDYYDINAGIAGMAYAASTTGNSTRIHALGAG